MSENISSKKIVTRFAPSPTGFMHVGSIRTALYAWAWARKNNGTFILRIEDTDKAREVEGSIDHIMESLRWLGIIWDEGVDIGGPNGPYIQSQRLGSYIKYAKILLEKGYAYPDPYSEEEVEAFRKKSEADKKLFLYRDYRPETTSVWDGKCPLRFKVPEVKKYMWHDAVRGELSAGEDALDDFILIKSDGYPTYNFAHIIDDLEMGVTHIMRADEFIASTPKFLSLYDALGITAPIFVTLPPILGKEGTKKLGKRDGAKDILDYRKEGYIPEAVVNFLALLGWNPGGDRELMQPSDIINLFDIEKIHKGGAMLDENKLTWFNKEHMKLQSPEKQYAGVVAYMSEYNEDMLRRLLPTVIDRISYYGEVELIKKEEFDFLIQAPVVSSSMLVWKTAPLQEAENHLQHIVKLLMDASITSVEDCKVLIMPYADAHGRGNVLWPLRVALSGKEKSIDPFTLCYVLGKDEAIQRVNTALQVIKEASS